MVSKKKFSFVEVMRKLNRAGIDTSLVPNRLPNDLDSFPSIDERIERVIGVLANPLRPISNMLFFVMYDIENNKVRSQIAKYLIRKGCTRVQRSIFLADLNATLYESIKSDLLEVQAMYDNHDSIMIVPISTDNLKSMKVIGQSIDVDIIMKSKNTLFF